MMAGGTPIVSVVVPTFNAGPLLLDTLRAVRAQTAGPVELIVVDDGSDDDTPQRVRRADPAAIVLEQTNSGVSTARNRGLAAATAPHVIFLDQDDIWHPRFLELLLHCLHHHPDALAAATPYQFWHPDALGQYPAEPWPPAPADRQRLVPGYETWTYHQFMRDCWALTSATLLRTEAVRAVGGFDEALPYSEDWDLWLRLSRRGHFVQLPWPPVLYRQHPTQGSRTARPRDYRTDLLLRNQRQHGLASPDGQALPRREFFDRIARYRMEYGWHLMGQGEGLRAARALLAAWVLRPVKMRWLLLALVALASPLLGRDKVQPYPVAVPRTRSPFKG